MCEDVSAIHSESGKVRNVRLPNQPQVADQILLTSVSMPIPQCHPSLGPQSLLPLSLPSLTIHHADQTTSLPRLNFNVQKLYPSATHSLMLPSEAQAHQGCPSLHFSISAQPLARDSRQGSQHTGILRIPRLPHRYGAPNSRTGGILIG